MDVLLERSSFVFKTDSALQAAMAFFVLNQLGLCVLWGLPLGLEQLDESQG
jgi:hypothetical protein